MILALQIGVGIWLGGMFLIGTITAAFAVHDKLQHNRRYGHPWHRGFLKWV